MKKTFTLLFCTLFLSIIEAQVTPIVDADALSPLIEFKNKEYLIKYGTPGLKSTDGISASLTTEYASANGTYYSFTAKNANFLYVSENSQTATNLLVTNGSGGFTNIKSFSTTSSGSLPKIRLAPTLQVLATEEVKKNPNNFIGDKLIFTAIDPSVQVLHLWSSEGNSASTVKILSSTGLDIDVLDDSFGENIGGLVYFNGRTTTTDSYHLWRTDGTSAGTFPVTTSLGEKLYTPTKSTIESLNGELLFVATTNISNATTIGDLWKTNGTSNGTVKLFSTPYHGQYINNNTPSKFFGKIFQNKFYFFGNDLTIGGYYLYQTDGTLAGTGLLKNSNNQNIRAASVATVFYNDENYIYFPAKGKKELVPGFLIDWDFYYASQGTSATTKTIDEVENFPTINYVYKTTDGLIVNTGNNSFKLNGYNKPIKTVFTSTQLNVISGGFSHKSKVWFSASEGIVNEELWCSDATQEGTKRFADVIAGPDSSGPKQFFTINNDLFVFAKFGSQTGGFMIYKIGEDYIFNGLVSNSLSNPQNWNSGSLPTSVDNATIPAGFNTTLDNVNILAKDIIINSPINLAAGNLNISGNLNLGAKITLNNNNLNLKGTISNVTNGNATNYIVTNGTGMVNVENLNTTRGTVNLPIGTTTNYNPVSIANSGTSDTFSARVSEGNSSTNLNINATWEIAEAVSGGSNVNLTLGWNMSQENAGFVRNSAKVGHFTGGIWVEENSGIISGSNLYQITATGISTFSPFSVMNFSALGTTDFSKSKVQVFPNPFNDNLNISTLENGVVYFYDTSGKLVSTSLLIKGNNQLQKSSLNKGVYIYQIKNKEGNVVSSGKVIKK